MFFQRKQRAISGSLVHPHQETSSLLIIDPGMSLQIQLAGVDEVANKQELNDWLVDALRAHGGHASIVEVCKYIWQEHESDLRASGDLFFTWQYDVRWQATRLRQQKRMRDKDVSPKGVWELSR